MGRPRICIRSSYRQICRRGQSEEGEEPMSKGRLKRLASRPTMRYGSRQALHH